MSCRAAVRAPSDRRFILEDSRTLERDPVAGEGAIARDEFQRNQRRQQLEFLNERAAGLGTKFGQLLVQNAVSKWDFFLLGEKTGNREDARIRMDDGGLAFSVKL